MRADRLLSLMMLLQQRGQMTAEDLAAELEVSPRTIYRDIEALSTAGVPVYANSGPGGGYALLDSYRTTLTGLNTEEIRALFTLTIPSPLADLGLTQPLKAAMLKMTSSHPDRYNDQVDYIRQRLHLDATRWFQAEEAVPHLTIIQQAVWQNHQLEISYRRRGSVYDWTVTPYGLVAKAGVWYLVAAVNQEMRVYRVSRIESVNLLQTHFVRPENFDLADFWTKWVAEYETNLPQYPVTLRIGPDLVPILPNILGESVQPLIEQAEPETDGWRILQYTFERMEQAQAFILSMGDSAYVVAPEVLRVSILKLAKAVVAHYQ